MRTLAVATLCLLALAPAAGAGRPRPTAIVIVDWRGAWTMAERRQLADAMAIGLDAAGFDRVAGQLAEFKRDPRFQGCLSFAACRFEYARAHGAPFLLSAILVKQGASRRLAATLYNVSLLAQAQVLMKRPPDAARAATAARGLVEQLFARERQLPRGRLEIASAPPGDAVLIDGHAAGTTDLVQPLYAGPHVVRVERKGVQPHITRLNLVADQSLRYEARFEKAVVPPLR